MPEESQNLQYQGQDITYNGQVLTFLATPSQPEEPMIGIRTVKEQVRLRLLGYI